MDCVNCIVKEVEKDLYKINGFVKVDLYKECGSCIDREKEMDCVECIKIMIVRRLMKMYGIK